MFKIDIIDNIKTDSRKIHFSDAFEKQKIILDEIINKKRNESLWFLEHDPVYTAGKSISDDEIFETQDQIPTIKTNRGGKFTYHGPGQLIVYIFLNIKNVFYDSNPDLQKFIFLIEKWVLNSLSDLEIKNLSLKPEVNHGVWIENKKISIIILNIVKNFLLLKIVLN
jgi:lipoyl(octanoyl) transferase